MLDSLTFPEDCKRAPNTRRSEVAAVGEQLNAALGNPIEFPDLSQAIIPGDRIAISVSRQIPEVELLLTSLLDYLFESGVQPSDVCVVLPSGFSPGGADPEKVVSSEYAWKRIGESVLISSYDSENPDSVAYLGVDAQGDTVYVNRPLFDADMVIPIIRNDQAGQSTCDGVVPEFCYRQRFEESVAEVSGGSDDFDAEQINDQLGIFFVIEVVVGPGNRIENILCGNRQDVQSRREQELGEIWAVEPSGDFDLIVATVEGETDEQNWESIYRAVHCANQISESSELVLLSQLSEKPDRNLKKVLSAELEGEAERRQIPEALRGIVDRVGRGPIFLMSQLSREQVEGLGMGYVDEIRQIQKLIDQSSRCLVLRDAHRCRVQNPVG